MNIDIILYYHIIILSYHIIYYSGLYFIADILLNSSINTFSTIF
jgi:hypothetical protein